jgi:hypothetical protein
MKKLCCVFLIMNISFACLTADETNDQKALEIRKAQAILKSKTKRTEVVKDDMSSLHEDLINSGVIDTETINSSKTAGELMNNVTNVRLKKTNEELLKAEMGKGDARSSATKEAGKELKEGISELNKIRKLAAMKANKAKLQAKLSDTVTDLKSLNDKLKAELKKELAGEKPNQEKINEMAEKQEKIADELKQLTEDVLNAEKKADNPEDKKDLDKVAEALAGEKPKDENNPEDKKAEAPPNSAEKKAEDVAKKIEEKDLAEALKKQNELIEKLDKAAKELANDNKKNDEPMTPEEKAAQELAELANEISEQNDKLEDIKEEHEGDENLQQDEKFNEALEKQNKLEKVAKSAKEKLKNEPKSKADLEKAEKSLAEAKKELEEGDLKEAMEKNDEAEKNLNEALDKLEKDEKSSAKDKKKPQKGKNGKEEKKPEEKGEKTEPEMEEVKTDFDDTQKAKEGERDIDKIHLRDNKLQLGDMPTAEAVWGNKVGEKDKKVLMQSLREKAPKEYDDLTQKYFEALASIGE